MSTADDLLRDLQPIFADDRNFYVSSSHLRALGDRIDTYLNALSSPAPDKFKEGYEAWIDGKGGNSPVRSPAPDSTLAADLTWALDTIVWMSAASDFVEGGFAHDGWVKVRAQMYDVLQRNHTRAALEARQPAPDTQESAYVQRDEDLLEEGYRQGWDAHIEHLVKADTQGSEGLVAALEPVFQMALESLPPPAHEGACTPETMCDMDCSDRYYGFELIGKARAALTAAPAAEEGE